MKRRGICLICSAQGIRHRARRKLRCLSTPHELWRRATYRRAPKQRSKRECAYATQRHGRGKLHLKCEIFGAVRARLKFASQARRDYGALDFKIPRRNLNFASKAEILNPRGLFCGVLLAVLGICAQMLRAAPQNFNAEAACDKIPPPARLPLKTLALKPCDAQDARSVSQIDRRAAA